MSGFWQAPRRLTYLLERGDVTPTEFALVMYVGLRYQGSEGDGIATTKAELSGLLVVSYKTVQRALARLSSLGLLEHDLRQGQRKPFLVRLGAAARFSTSDTQGSVVVRSDLGQRVVPDSAAAAETSEVAVLATSDSRVRARETETTYKDLSDKATRDEPQYVGLTPANLEAQFIELLGEEELADVVRQGFTPEVRDSILRGRVRDALATNPGRYSTKSRDPLGVWP